MADRLRVLHVGKFYPPHRGGIETHVHGLCTALKDYVDVEVIVSSDTAGYSMEIIDGVKVRRLPAPVRISTAPISPSMIQHLARADAEIIHVHLPHPWAVLACLAARIRGRLVATYHSDTVRQAVLGMAFNPFLQTFLRRAAAIAATSQRYVETSPVLASMVDRCRIVPLGIDQTAIHNAAACDIDTVRNRFGGNFILTVGRHVSYKGFEHLIAAMQWVRSSLVLTGGGPLRSDLEQLSKRLNVADRVHFAGEVPDVAPYYRAAAVFVLPSVSRAEAFGIVQIEAMAAGIPVVNTHLDSGVPFVSPGGITGLTVPPADPRALADAINVLLADRELRQRMGAAGRERAALEFSLDTMVQRTLAVYDEVSGGGRIPALCNRTTREARGMS